MIEEFDEVDSSKEDGRATEYNSAALINLRINTISTDCTTAATKGRYNLWNEFLDRFWVEVCGSVKKNGKEEKELKEINLRIANFGNLDGAKQNNFGLMSQEEFEKRIKIKETLIEKEMFLRRLLNTLGMGIKQREEDDFY